MLVSQTMSPPNPVSSAINSQVILDQSGAQHLLGRGDMFVGGPFALRRLQAPLATPGDIARLIF